MDRRPVIHMKGDWEPDAVMLLDRLTGFRYDLRTGPVPDGSPCRVMVGGTVSGEELCKCPRLSTILVPYAGIPERTREAASLFPGVEIRNIHHNAVAASEIAVALMMCAAKLLIPADSALRKNDWTPRYRPEGILVEDSRVLVLGWGAIGRRIGRACEALGARVTGYSRSMIYGASETSRLHDLLPEADILFVCVPLSDVTEGMIGERELSLLPRGAILVNVARGPVVDEEALYRSLEKGHLGAAGLDVWYSYPKDEEARADTPPSRYDFAALPNVVMSPHRGGAFGLPGIERRRMEHLAEALNSLFPPVGPAD